MPLVMFQGHAESDVAFKITVRSQSRADFQNFDGLDPSQVDIDVCHDTVSEAIQGAVETAVQEVNASQYSLHS